MRESSIVWQGNVMFVQKDALAPVLGPYAVCVSGSTHAVIVGRTADKAKALRVAQRMDKYPANARKFAGLV